MGFSFTVQVLKRHLKKKNQKRVISGQPGWYSQPLQLLHVIKSPTLDHCNLIFHQLPAEREERGILRDDAFTVALTFFFHKSADGHSGSITKQRRLWDLGGETSCSMYI